MTGWPLVAALTAAYTVGTFVGLVAAAVLRNIGEALATALDALDRDGI